MYIYTKAREFMKTTYVGVIMAGDHNEEYMSNVLTLKDTSIEKANAKGVEYAVQWALNNKPINCISKDLICHSNPTVVIDSEYLKRKGYKPQYKWETELDKNRLNRLDQMINFKLQKLSNERSR